MAFLNTFKYISCNNSLFTTDTMSSSQITPARSRTNNQCQQRPNNNREPRRNGQAQTDVDEEEVYSKFRVGLALGVLFVMLGIYNMYTNNTK